MRRLAQEQAALRRVATLVARGATPEEVFTAVAGEVGQLLRVELATLFRYEPGRTAASVTTWGPAGRRFPVGSRWPLEGHNVATLVFETGRPVRIDRYADSSSGPIGAAIRETGIRETGIRETGIRETGIRSAVRTPILVEGRLWGMIAAGSTLEQPLPADTEARLASSPSWWRRRSRTAESRAELMASRARIVAAADETRRRIERDLHDGTDRVNELIEAKKHKKVYQLAGEAPAATNATGLSEVLRASLAAAG